MVKFVTSSRDGTIKIWSGLGLKHEKTIYVSRDNNIRKKVSKKKKEEKCWVTAIAYMTLSKRLVAACANRTLSFYDFNT